MTIWTCKFIALWVVLSICLLVSIAVFVSFKFTVESEVDDASELCARDFINIDFFRDPPKQVMEVYVYNISNPTEYLDGGEARLHEKGPYPFNLKVNREFLEFPDHGKFMNYTQVNLLSFAEGSNCKGCGHAYEEQITVLNPVYLAVLEKATSEATMLMSASCSTTQLGLLKLNPAAPYCKKTDLGTGAMCRCCVPPIDGFNGYAGLNDSDYNDPTWAFCDEVTSPQGSQAGLFGWLGMYDGAHKLNSLPSSFQLSSGTYTNLLRTFSVSELLTGSMSALAGMINFRAAAATKDVDPVSAELYDGILNATQDMKDVCYNPNFDFCPQLSAVQAVLNSIVNANPMVALGMRINYIKSIRCSGNIPDYQELIDVGGLSEQRALQLRYLEGLPCNNFAAGIAFAALINNVPGSSGTCADGGSKPCCLSAFSLQGGASTGSGIGCLRFVDGVLQKKRVYSAEDARDVVGTTVKQRTVCNSENKLQLFEYFGRSRFNEWFSPASYTFGGAGAAGVMPWADPVVINNAGTVAVPGDMTEVDVSEARAVNQIVPGELGRTFLARNLNNGDPNDEAFYVFATQFLRNFPAKFVKTEDKYGLQSVLFRLMKLYGRDDAADEDTERSGQMPYPNMYNLIYSEEGKPAILCRPNFLDVNEAIYSQENNAKRGVGPGAGVKLYRTRSKYSGDAGEIEPELITAAFVDSRRDAFESSWNYEPTTGLTITSTISAQFNMFTMNCNPYIDSFCSVRAEQGLDMCYPRMDSDNMPYTVPCSFANVLTPKVHGEKVFPFYWNSVTTKPPQDVIDRVLLILDTRFAFSVLIVIFAVLMFVLIVYTIVAWRNDDSVNPPAPVATDEGQADLKKEAHPEGGIAMTGVIVQSKQENI